MLITNNPQSALRKHTIKREITFGPLSLRFITVIIIAVLCILYLAQSTRGATKNYALQELQQKQAEVQKENDRLKIEATRLQALSAIDQQKKEENQNNNSLQNASTNPEYVQQ